MSRYIVCRECESSDCCGCNIYTLARALVQGKLDWMKDEKNSIQMPTISSDDVRGVGKWIALEPEIGLCCCSICDHKIIRADCNYCPNCGAKMEGQP